MICKIQRLLYLISSTYFLQCKEMIGALMIIVRNHHGIKYLSNLLKLEPK